MRVLVGGGTGFVGRYLQQILCTKGHDVVLISRSAGSNHVSWADIRSGGLPNDTEAVVNIAGENLMNPMRRWDDDFIADLWTSRVDTTKDLVQAINAAEKKPKVFVSSSAVGYYAPSTTAEYTEDSHGGDSDILARLCQDWEDAAKLPEGCPTRHVCVRIGLALGREGGAIKNMILPFYFGAGGPISTGKQWFPWIHVHDVAGIIAHAIEHDHVHGVLNATAPEYITNGEFTKAFGKALWRPAMFPVPAFALNMIYGAERAKAMVEGQKVIPKRTLESGYVYKYPDIQSASKEFARLFIGEIKFDN